MAWAADQKAVLGEALELLPVLRAAPQPVPGPPEGTPVPTSLLLPRAMTAPALLQEM